MSCFSLFFWAIQRFISLLLVFVLLSSLLSWANYRSYISQPHHTMFWGLIGTISNLVGVKYICLCSMWYQFCFVLFKSNATLKSVSNLDELHSTVYYSNLFCGNCAITFTNGYIFQEQQIDPKNLTKQHGGDLPRDFIYPCPPLVQFTIFS